MTAAADILYLPILTPARIEVGYSRTPTSNAGAGEQRWRQRLHRVQMQPRPTQSMAYGPDGRMTMDASSGRLVDLFA